jgi:hypothetical protein
MAAINIKVQSLLNASTFIDYSVDTADLVSDLKDTVAGAESTNVAWFNLSLNKVVLVNTDTLAAAGLVNGSVLYIGNLIGHLATREDRQEAKLALAELRRKAGGNTSAPYYHSLNTANIDLLPTKWSGNTLVDNPNPGGLQPGRPWY